jgi:excisionase family DNA binding protein
MSLYISPEVERAGAIISRHLTVQAAATHSGYSIQYLRRLLRSGSLEGTKIGQVWLIELDAFERYIDHARQRNDRRCGPRNSVAVGTDPESAETVK